MNDIVGGSFFTDPLEYNKVTIDLFLQSLNTFNVLISESVVDDKVINDIKLFFSLKNNPNFDIKQILSFAIGELTSLVKKDIYRESLYFCVKDFDTLKLYYYNILTSEFSYKEYLVSSEHFAQQIFMENDSKQKINKIISESPGYFLSHTSSLLCNMSF